jgi:hypothetical protein
VTAPATAPAPAATLGPAVVLGPAAVLGPRTVEEIVRRAGRRDFDRWAEQVAGCGYCARPVRLRGHIEHRTPAGGRRVTYSTSSEPDRVLLIRCGNRRAAACPSCSYEYAGDMWQLLYAGAAGGRKGVPHTIRTHPLVFTTLTAPGFGPVHTTRTDHTRNANRTGNGHTRSANRTGNGPTGGSGRTGGGSARCRPARGTPRLCPHGRPTWCNTVHPEHDPRLGQPICADCYDYPAHVAFNWHAPELWRRFTIAVRRALAKQAGLTAAEFTSRCRVSFVKVAEFQRRGVIHFHALIRLDGPSPPGHYNPPPADLDTTALARAIHHAAAHVRLTVPLPDNTTLALRFGDQLDTQPINHGPTGDLTPEHAARYIAKYTTKAAEDFGLDHRRITPAALPHLNITHHTTRILQHAWTLGAHPAYGNIRRWLHMLAFHGHFTTKSRRYSTTLGALRTERRTYRQQQAATTPAHEPATEHEPTLTVGHWEFTGLGYLTTGDATLAISAAARAREQRQAARDATRDAN